MSAVTHDEPRLESITVCHYARSNFAADEYGGRGVGNAHAANTDPGEKGWLGNPHKVTEDTVEARRAAIAAWTRYFLDRVESDPTFREAVLDLRGDRVACWCRGVSQDRTPDRWCHLDVVEAWLSDDLTPVWEYLRGEYA